MLKDPHVNWGCHRLDCAAEISLCHGLTSKAGVMVMRHEIQEDRLNAQNLNKSLKVPLSMLEVETDVDHSLSCSSTLKHLNRYLFSPPMSGVSFPKIQFQNMRHSVDNDRTFRLLKIRRLQVGIEFGTTHRLHKESKNLCQQAENVEVNSNQAPN